MITQLKLDESAKLEFGVSVTGADARPISRFIIEGKHYSIMLPCENVNESVSVEIPVLKNILPAGDYQVRLEVLIDNKIYTPLTESITLKPAVEISTKQHQIPTIKESVKVASVVVKPSINEEMLRKMQAAMIIAKSLGYTSFEGQHPSDIIENAIKSAGEMTQDTAAVVEEMLKLAESTGIEVSIKPVVKSI